MRGPLAIKEALGQSEAFLTFQAHLSEVAPVERPVLIIGERGSGKELVASRLHYLSQRWQEPLVTLNCSALSPSVLESELFGHEAGSFTGASKRRQGRFEAASGGTLFLDEIGLIPMQVQEKILRVVEYGVFERVGGSDAISVDVRILGATNADLPSMVSKNEFKADLLDRLSFEVLKVPPLRERGHDILLLAHHFALRMAMELGRHDTPEFSESVVEQLLEYEWPGNVRELKNAVERSVYRAKGRTIEHVELNPFGSAPATNPAPPSDSKSPRSRASNANEEEITTTFQLGQDTLPQFLHDLEGLAISHALKKSKHHQGKAARLLGLTYHQFRNFYRKHQKPSD